MSWDRDEQAKLMETMDGMLDMLVDLRGFMQTMQPGAEGEIQGGRSPFFPEGYENVHIDFTQFSKFATEAGEGAKSLSKFRMALERNTEAQLAATRTMTYGGVFGTIPNAANIARAVKAREGPYGRKARKRRRRKLMEKVYSARKAERQRVSEAKAAIRATASQAKAKWLKGRQRRRRRLMKRVFEARAAARAEITKGNRGRERRQRKYRASRRRKHMERFNARNAPKKFWSGIRNRLLLGYHTKYGAYMRAFGAPGVALAAGIAATHGMVRFGEMQVDANRQFGRYSPQTMMQLQQFQMAGLMRDIRMGQETTATAIKLIQSVNYGEEAMQPLYKAYRNVMNVAGGVAAEFGGGIATGLKPLADVISKVSEESQGLLGSVGRFSGRLTANSMLYGPVIGPFKTLWDTMFGKDEVAEQPKQIMLDFIKGADRDKPFSPKPVRF